ncbi:MAG: hypothetical protein RBJ76_25105 [Stenomitos frigidus ULC029]
MIEDITACQQTEAVLQLMPFSIGPLIPFGGCNQMVQLMPSTMLPVVLWGVSVRRSPLRQPL